MNFNYLIIKKTTLFIGAVVFLMLSTYGCATFKNLGGMFSGGTSASSESKKEEKPDAFFDKWSSMAKTSKGFSPSAKRRGIEVTEVAEVAAKTEKVETVPPPPPVQTPDMKKDPTISKKKDSAKSKGKEDDDVEASYKEPPFPTDRISMKMHDTEIPILLRALARAANQNIIINENVKGKTNINIANAPWDQVFLGILKTNGLTYRWEGDIIRIVTMQDLKQELDILEAKQQLAYKRAEFDEKMKSKTRESEIAEPLTARMVPIDFADAENLKQNLEKFLTGTKDGKMRGSVVVDKHTNTLIIQGTRSDIKKMLPIIQELDRPTPQILIEAHVVEATKETARELGIQWGGLYKGYGGGARQWITPAATTGLGGTTFLDNDTGANPPVGMFTGSGSGLGPAAASAAIGLNYVYEKIGQSMLITQLTALQKDGKANILSSPSITTLDNQKASIESGKDVPYQTVENGEVKITYRKAVVKLEVIPHVIDGKSLKMDIITHKDELSATGEAVQGNPVILTKRAETKVLLLDGQTTVIGGLTKETGSDSKTGVPLLQEIPLIGHLFKGTNKKKTMEELLIFITPHILKEQSENAVTPPTSGETIPQMQNQGGASMPTPTTNP
ncbi:MAG: type IV pilus secretin PilQ [Desulfobacterales bacterium]|nr:type IV pilus secretin PilQ [Desulfobacterales bacterium]